MSTSRLACVAAFLIVLPLVGAGCATNSPAPAAPSTNQEMPSAAQPTPSAVAPTPTPTTAPAPKPTTTTTKPKTTTSSGTTTTKPKTVVVTIKNMTFSPMIMAVNAGDTVVWKNSDTVPHTSTADGGGLIWDSGTISPGASFTRVFKSPGNYTYHCNIHTSMTGSIVVH